MTKTKPPCYNPETKGDCPRRYIGCRAGCEDWHRWLAIHEAEKEQERRKRDFARDADGFLSEQSKRIQLAYHREYMREKGS